MKKTFLIVDDSALMRRVICDIISTDPNFEVADNCRDGLEALEKLRTNKYDCVLLDVEMPRMDGLQLLRKLQEEGIKANVVMVSTLTSAGAKTTLEALELGAIDFVTKPTNVIEAKGEDFKKKLISVLGAVLKIKVSVPNRTETPNRSSGAKIVYAKPGSALNSPDNTGTQIPKAAEQKPMKLANITRLKASGNNKLVALACSTGGPKALQDVIPYLPKDLDAPMVLVQHMPMGFTKSMAERLNDISKINVKEAEDGEKLKKGWVYIAPGGHHITVVKTSDGGHKIVYNELPAIGGLKPCANIMFDSLSDTGFDEIVCVVLTGMGADGTNGILSLCQRKPIHVIAQNEETCVVYGMPRAIAESGVVDEVVPLKEVAKTIVKNLGVK